MYPFSLHRQCGVGRILHATTQSIFAHLHFSPMLFRVHSSLTILRRTPRPLSFNCVPTHRAHTACSRKKNRNQTTGIVPINGVASQVAVVKVCLYYVSSKQFVQQFFRFEIHCPCSFGKGDFASGQFLLFKFVRYF